MLWDIIRLDLLFCVLNGQRTLVIYIIRSYIMLACICACDFVCIFVCLNNFAIDLHWKIAETFKMCMLLHIHSNYSSNKNTGNISEKSEIKLSLCMCVLFFSFASSVLLLLLYFIQFLFENVNLFFLSLFVSMQSAIFSLYIWMPVIPIISVSAFTALMCMYVCLCNEIIGRNPSYNEGFLEL